MMMKIVRYSLLVVAASAGVLWASQSQANAAAPAVSAPVGGGMIDSVIGIGRGAVAGITPVLGLPTL